MLGVRMGHGGLDSLGSGGQRLTSAGTQGGLPQSRKREGFSVPARAWAALGGPRAFKNKCGPQGVGGGGTRPPFSGKQHRGPRRASLRHVPLPVLTGFVPATLNTTHSSDLGPGAPPGGLYRARPETNTFPPQHTHRANSVSTPFLRIQKPPSPLASSCLGLRKRTSLSSAWCGCTWCEQSTCSPKTPMAW